MRGVSKFGATRPVCVVTGSAWEQGSRDDTVRPGPGNCSHTGISWSENESKLTEIRETRFQGYTGSGSRWSKGIETGKHGSEFPEKSRSVHQPDRIESKLECGEGMEARGCVHTRTQEKICRKLECAFNYLLFLPISCLNNSRLSDWRQKSSILELVHAELL